MSSVNASGLLVLMLAGTLLGACGSGAPPHSSYGTAAVDATPGVTGRSSGSGPDHSGRQPTDTSVPATSKANGSSVDVIEVSKCYTNATARSGGQLLIKARSSDLHARLLAYRPDGALIGEVQNGGSNRYGGTVIAYLPYDPVKVTVRSSAGGTTTVPTTAFQPDN